MLLPKKKKKKIQSKQGLDNYVAKGHCKGEGAGGEFAPSSHEALETKFIIKTLTLKSIIMNVLIDRYVHEMEGHCLKEIWTKSPIT